MTTHAHKRPMRMRNMPEVAAPELRQKSLLSYTEISEKTLDLVRFFWEWRTPRPRSTGPTGQDLSILHGRGSRERTLVNRHQRRDKKKYDKVMEKFDLYFAVRRNVIARFNRRVLHEGESAEVYISELYEPIEFCDYGNLKDEMLRDRLVVGIRDTSLSEKMQTDPALTLEKAKTMIRQREAVKEQRRNTPSQR